jgi:DNA repair protein RadA/Sms
MAKAKTIYYCQNCGTQSATWVGKCRNCGQWDTYVEEVIRSTSNGNKPLSVFKVNRYVSMKSTAAVHNIASMPA